MPLHLWQCREQQQWTVHLRMSIVLRLEDFTTAPRSVSPFFHPVLRTQNRVKVQNLQLFGPNADMWTFRTLFPPPFGMEVTHVPRTGWVGRTRHKCTGAVLFLCLFFPHDLLLNVSPQQQYVSSQYRTSQVLRRRTHFKTASKMHDSRLFTILQLKEGTKRTGS